MDGVIADTTEHHYQSWRRLGEEEGMTFSRDDNEGIRGMTRRASLEVFLRGRVLDDTTAQAWMTRKNQYFHENMRQMTPDDALPGVIRLLDEIKVAGLKLGVGSSSRNARPVLEQLQLAARFEVIGDGHVVINSKPAPDIFMWVAGALRLFPSQILILEDAGAGVEAALNAGFHVVGIGNAPGIEQAHHTVDSLADVHLADLLALFETLQKT